MTNPTPTPIADELMKLVNQVAATLNGCSDSLIHGESRRAVLADMTRDLADIGRWLADLSERVEAAPPPVPPGRPLEASFAEIRAEGHTCITVFTNVYNGKPYSRCSSHLPEPERSDPTGTTLSYEGWATKVEYGEATVEFDDMAAAAEARLAQIRELHAAAVQAQADAEWDGLTHSGTEDLLPACDAAGPGTVRLTYDPEKVTCLACLERIGRRPVEVHALTPEQMEAAAAAFRRQHDEGAEVSVTVTAWPGVAGQITGSAIDIPGTEPVDSEHAAVIAEDALRTAEASENLQDAIDADDGVVDGEKR